MALLRLSHLPRRDSLIESSKGTEMNALPACLYVGNVFAMPVNRHTWAAIFCFMALVLLLCVKGGPAAVFWSVISIIIYAVYRVLFAGPVTHIGNEVCEVKPPLADAYSPSAVVLKGLVIGVVASLSHFHPRPVFWGVRVSMFEVVAGFGSNAVSHVATSYSSVVRGLDIGVSSSRHFTKKASEMQEAFA